VTTPESVTRTWASADAAEAWQRSAARRNAALGTATERMLDRAVLRPGMRVLDLCAGTGEQSLAAAQRVVPGGEVLATDVSESMLDVAARSAAEARLPVRTRVMDASAVDLAPRSFDAAICRLGLMFLPDVGAGLRGVRTALKPGARLAGVVWSAPERNPMMSLPRKLALELGIEAPPDLTLQRSMSLADPDKLRRAFDDAGWSDVLVEAISTPRRFESAAEVVQYARYESPAHRELGQHLSDVDAERLWQAVHAAFKEYETPDGCVLPGEVLVCAGTA
jgi:SAM-dependent methyltransferase